MRFHFQAGTHWATRGSLLRTGRLSERLQLLAVLVQVGILEEKDIENQTEGVFKSFKNHCTHPSMPRKNMIRDQLGYSWNGRKARKDDFSFYSTVTHIRTCLK